MNNAINLQEINQEQALNLCKFFIKAKSNIFFFGRKGVGKSHIAMRAIQECNYTVNYINLSVIDRNDLIGYPNMFTDSDIVTFKSPIYLPKLVKNTQPNTVILFDEVDKASPEITAPLLEILQFKTINGDPINVVACVLTGNLLNEGAYANLISTALLDRGAKYILQFDFNQWLEWAKLNNVHDLILGFLKSNVELACGQIEDSCYASPSPRGWTLASEALIKAKELKINDVDTITHIISGYVGKSAGLKFQMWYEYYRKFDKDVAALINCGSMKLDFNSLSATEKIVFIIAACYQAKQKTLDLLKLKNRFIYLKNLCVFFNNYSIDNEMKVVGLCNAFSFELITKNKLYECKEFFDLFTKINSNVTIRK